MILYKRFKGQQEPNQALLRRTGCRNIIIEASLLLRVLITFNTQKLADEFLKPNGTI
jgi:hypothetical protein